MDAGNFTGLRNNNPLRCSLSKGVVILRVGLLLSPGFANLSFAPLAAFETANLIAEPFYELHVVSPNGGPIENSFGMVVQTERAEDAALDTVIVGAPQNTRPPPAEIVEFLQQSYREARRIASICVASFILGEAAYSTVVVLRHTGCSETSWSVDSRRRALKLIEFLFKTAQFGHRLE
jgi:hypothetical protein